MVDDRDIVERLLSRAWDDRHHRKYREEAAAEITRLRAEVERLTAKAAEWDQRDGIDGAACSAIREMLDSLGVPRAAFIDDHVANAYLHGKAEAMERAAQIAENTAFMMPIDWWMKSTKKEVSSTSCLQVAAAIRAEASKGP